MKSTVMCHLYAVATVKPQGTRPYIEMSTVIALKVAKTLSLLESDQREQVALSQVGHKQEIITPQRRQIVVAAKKAAIRATMTLKHLAARGRQKPV
jgi:hypothetical protein